MSTSPIDNLRRVLQARRKQLTEKSQQFDILAEKEPEEFKKMTLKMLGQYALAMETLYSHIEQLSVANFALKEQIEVLKDIIQSLPDVTRNPAMQKDIERAFKHYGTSF